jgi:hypothetical protein
VTVLYISKMTTPRSRSVSIHQSKQSRGLEFRILMHDNEKTQMELLIIATIIGLIPAAIAASKGRNFLLWWFYGAALFIIALPHSLMLKLDEKAMETEKLASGENRKCPFCAEIIKAEAKVCRYCGRDVEPVLVSVTGPSLQCPGCKTPVEADTKKCPGCGGLFKAGVDAGLTEEGDRRNHWTTFAVAFGSIAALVLIMYSISRHSSNGPTTAPEPVASVRKPPLEEPAPASPWNVSTSTNDVTSVQTVVASTGYRDHALIIRRIGRKLECYITTGEFLETVENMESNIAGVAYKFDDRPIVRQGWHMATDHESLFYPGDPSLFLAKMRKAKQLSIEYKPADKVPQTISFDVSQFPAEFVPTVDSSSTRVKAPTRVATAEEQRLDRLNNEALRKRNAAMAKSNNESK